LVKGDGFCREGGVGEDKENKFVVFMYTSTTILEVRCRGERGGGKNNMIHRCATATHRNTVAVCVAEQGVVLRRVAVACAGQHGYVAKEPYKGDYILEKKRIILSILLTVSIL